MRHRIWQCSADHRNPCNAKLPRVEPLARKQGKGADSIFVFKTYIPVASNLMKCWQCWRLICSNMEFACRDHMGTKLQFWQLCVFKSTVSASCRSTAGRSIGSEQWLKRTANKKHYTNRQRRRRSTTSPQLYKQHASNYTSNITAGLYKPTTSPQVQPLVLRNE